MPTTDRASWLAERRLGIGGSDIASVFNVGWGCRRRLFYDKRGTPIDFDDSQKLKKLFLLGNTLEPMFADMYAGETGRRVVVRFGPLIDPETPHLRVNIDRAVWATPMHSERGPLEVKAQGREVFYRSKREGLSYDYLLQLQAGIMAARASWGAFAIGNRDNGDLIHFDVERSEDLCSEIKAEVPKMWAAIENGPAPDPLPDDQDKRCVSCPWRVTCRGDKHAFFDQTSDFIPMSELSALATEWRERRALRDEAKELFDETDSELKAGIGDNTSVDTGAGKFTYYSSPRKGYTVAATTVRTLRSVK